MKKSNIYLICTAALVVLMSLAVLSQRTGAKYTEERVLYTSFGIANFNVVLDPGNIRGPDGSGEQTQEVAAITELPRFHPGMSWNADPAVDSSAYLPFTVSNGTGEDSSQDIEADISDLGVKYTVRLRTAQSLPLDFVLGYEIEEDTWVYYRSAGTPEEIEIENSETRYEYRFLPEPVSEEEESGNGGNQAQTLAAGELPAEPEFRIVPYTVSEDTAPEGGTTEDGIQSDVNQAAAPADTDTPEVLTNQHRLFFEWPVEEEGDNSTELMKEVELIELIVTAASLNRLDETGYYKVMDSEGAADPPYTGGILLMLPPTTGTAAGYKYTVDLRSFQLKEITDQNTNTVTKTGEFEFSIDNAFNFRQEQNFKQTVYSMEVKIPAELVVSSGSGLSLSLKRSDGTEEFLPSSPSEYCLFDEKAGDWLRDEETKQRLSFPNIAELDSDPDYKQYSPDYVAPEKDTSVEGGTTETGPEIKPEIRLYAIYSVNFNGQNILYNAASTTTGSLEPQAASHYYVLKISGENLSAQFVTENCFASKIELYLTAQFNEPITSAAPENKEENGARSGTEGEEENGTQSENGNGETQ